jgi:hypothetical protein
MRTSGRLASIGLAFALITGVAERVISQTVDPAQALAWKQVHGVDAPDVVKRLCNNIV